MESQDKRPDWPNWTDWTDHEFLTNPNIVHGACYVVCEHCAWYHNFLQVPYVQPVVIRSAAPCNSYCRECYYTISMSWVSAKHISTTLYEVTNTGSLPNTRVNIPARAIMLLQSTQPGWHHSFVSSSVLCNAVQCMEWDSDSPVRLWTICHTSRIRQ